MERSQGIVQILILLLSWIEIEGLETVSNGLAFLTHVQNDLAPLMGETDLLLQQRRIDFGENALD